MNILGNNNTQKFVRCATLLALEVILNLAGSVTIGSTVRISFGYICGATCALLYGPIPAILVEASADILGAFIKPIGQYFPGFTVSAALGGLIYGLCLYKRPVSWKNVLLAKVLVIVFVNIFCNTLWLSMLYGKAFWAILPPRLLKNGIMLVVDFFLLLPILKFVEKRFLT
ncbi:MAG: folate family ECF transporter S component [Christensenellales bacterium]|jgi:ECF transporter S component (folate family)